MSSNLETLAGEMIQQVKVLSPSLRISILRTPVVEGEGSRVCLCVCVHACMRACVRAHTHRLLFYVTQKHSLVLFLFFSVLGWGKNSCQYFNLGTVKITVLKVFKRNNLFYIPKTRRHVVSER